MTEVVTKNNMYEIGITDSHKEKMKNKLRERFLNYLRIHTEAINGSQGFPSSEGQVVFAQILVEELKKIGLEDVDFINGVVYATKRSNSETDHESIGFVSHIDTYPWSGNGTDPIIVEDYYGPDALRVSNKSYPNAVLSVLNECYLHHSLVISNRKVPLGGDDKAGIAEIITAMEYLIENEISTRNIYLAFTCDEEIGRGANLIDFSKFIPDYTIVVDGEAAGEINISDMSVFSCGINVRGQYVFLGKAKGVMKNAIDIVYELMDEFSEDAKPQNSENDEGFYHFSKIQGDTNNAILMCTIMSFDKEDMEKRISKLYEVCRNINNRLGSRTVSVMFPNGGYNECSIVTDDGLVRKIEKAMISNNIECKRIKFRGVTDANIFREIGREAITIGIGGGAFHSIFEWASINDMEKITNVIITLCSNQ